MKLRHFIFPVMALMGMMTPASGIAPREARITAPASSQHHADMLRFMAGSQPSQPDPPPWLRPNQRQRRLANRRRHAAGCRNPFSAR
jgi:hypothetical protein